MGIEAEVIEEKGGVRSRRLPEEGCDEALRALMADPQGALNQGFVCKRGSRGYAVAVRLAGLDCFVKHYRPLGFRYRFLNAFRESRALRAWKVSRHLQALGVAVPRPFFCVEWRRWRLLGDAYLATEFVAGGTDLLTWWENASSAERIPVLAECARVIGTLHARGWCHGDLKWRNLLVKCEEKVNVVLVDIDAAERCRWLRKRRVTADVARFLRDFQRVSASPAEVDGFLAEWRRIALDGSVAVPLEG